MIFRQLFDTATSTFTYLIGDETSRQAVLIDPVREQVERDLKLLRELDLKLTYILETHVHADHITGAGALRRETGAQTVGAAKGAACADLHVKEGDTLHVGAITLSVLGTPGHTDDSVSYRIADRVFTGDALLVRGCGRTDFQNGDAHTLHDSVTRVLFSLPDDTWVYPAHDYRGFSVTTIGEEKRHNPRFAGKGVEQFVELMNDLKLPRPDRINEAVPANRACGTLDGPVARIWGSATVSNGVSEVTAEAATQLRDKVRFIDVREPQEYLEGHIPGSELVPLRTVPDAAIGWRRDDPLLVVCRSGRRSAQAIHDLEQLGFSKLLSLQGGIVRWREAGLPIEANNAQLS